MANISKNKNDSSILSEKEYNTKTYCTTKDIFSRVLKQLEKSYDKKYYKIDSDNLSIEYKTVSRLDVGYVQEFLNGRLNVKLLNVVDDSN